MKISQVGRGLIAQNEGLRLNAYQDSVGVWTIGYGDTGPDVAPGLVITKAEAERRLSERLDREFGAAVNKAIGSAPTTQGQFDAMVSLAYNIGVGGFRGSSVFRHHIAGEHVAAADAFLAWNKAGRPLRVLAGLTRRRGEERALYLSTAAPQADLSVDPGPAARPAVERVKAIQQVLTEGGLYTRGIDGDWGARSADAMAELLKQSRDELARG